MARSSKAGSKKLARAREFLSSRWEAGKLGPMGDSPARSKARAPADDGRRRVQLSGVLIVSVIAVLIVAAVCVNRGEVKPDERVVLFPTAARLSGDGRFWELPIHGWVFEPELDDALRAATVSVIRRSLGLDEAAARSTLLDERLRPFLVDNQRSKRVIVRVAEQSQTMEPTDADGHFVGTVQVPVELAKRYARDGALTVTVYANLQSPTGHRGQVRLVGPQGVSVISDIDDTIKVTQVRDRKALLRNTLLRPFEAAPGMAELYRRWAAEGVTFHYVSGSPWQLYEPLVAFMKERQFPDATFMLKSFRLKDSSVLQLFADPIRTKLPAIESLLRDYPHRRFCLVGDSGERDPEIYALIARKHPSRIACIYIRNVTDEASDGPRFGDVFKDVSPERWRLFTDPSELPVPR